jgi:hypothetical protein
MNTAVAIDQPLAGVIHPRWWTGEPAIDPALFTINCAELDMGANTLDPDGELAQRMNRIFDDIGVVYLTNTGLCDLQAMRVIAQHVIKHENDYKGGANPRNNLQPNVYEVGAPLEAHLHYHHEMAYIDKSTRMLGFLCDKAADDGGHTYVSDNLRATDAILATDFGQKLKQLGLCYHRDLTDSLLYRDRDPIGVYNHWQQSMMTEDADDAVEVARRRGLHVEWGPERLMKTRYYTSAFEYYEPLDRNLLYSSVADDGMWFDSWPKVMHLPYEERPLKLTFGDDTEMSREEKKLFVDVYDRFGTPIQWQPGDIAIVCNFRFAHGRPSIHLQPGQQRELGVLIGEEFQRQAPRPDKW